MDFIKKIILIWFVIIPNIVFALPPIEKCNMNGLWYAELWPAYPFHVVQSGSSVIFTTPTLPPEDQFTGAGSVMPWGVEFYIESRHSERTELKGKFVRQCAAMIWQSVEFPESEDTMVRIPIKIVEPIEKELIITAEPRMPNFKAKVVLDGPFGLIKMNPDIPAYTWGIQINHDLGTDLHIDAYLDNVENDSDIHQPNFNSLKERITKDGKTSIVDVPGGVVGGQLTLSVDYYRNLHIEKKFSILKGTNPGQAAIEQVLTDKTLRQIACQESRYKQFIAPREGGVGKLNTKDRSRGGVGIMQLYEPVPTAAEIWNWRENLKGGMELYKEKVAIANNLPAKEFKDLNKERAEMGLPACTKPLPSLNSEQQEREVLRLYNCGHEYWWQPRNAPNCEGHWVQSLSCEREGKTGYDPEYVNNVLKCDINH